MSELIDARRAIRHWKAKSEKLEAKLDKAHSDIDCMVKKAAAKHRPAYDEQSMNIMGLQEQLDDAQEFAKRCANSPVGQMVKQLEAVREVYEYAKRTESIHEKAINLYLLTDVRERLKAAIEEIRNER